MLPYFILGLALLVAVILALRWFTTADPKSLATGVRVLAGVLVGVLALLLIASGRWQVALGTIGFLAPFFVRWRALANRLKAARGPTPGRTSEVRTPYFHMVLEHDTGVMDGEILKGAWTGRRLSELSLADLMALLAECRAADEESAVVLETYLDRHHPDWREAGAGDGGTAGGRERAGAGPAGGGRMTREEAYAVLGLEPGASEAEIKEAHHKLLAKIHPDHGGSDYLAAQINLAKETLLGS